METDPNWQTFCKHLNFVISILLKNCGWGGFSTFLRWRSRVFLNRTSLTPHQIFDAHLLENIDLSPSWVHFSVGFIKIMFWATWFYSLFAQIRLKRKNRCLFTLTNLYSHHFILKRYLFFAELAMSQHWSVIFCATGAWGGKPIGRVRVKTFGQKDNVESSRISDFAVNFFKRITLESV